MYDPIHDRYTKPAEQSASGAASSSPGQKTAQQHRESEQEVSYDFEIDDDPPTRPPPQQVRNSDKQTLPEQLRKKREREPDTDNNNNNNNNNNNGSEINEQEKTSLNRYEKPNDHQRAQQRREPEQEVSYDFEVDDDPPTRPPQQQDHKNDKQPSPEQQRTKREREPDNDESGPPEIDEQEKKRLKRYEKPKDRQRGQQRFRKEVTSGPFARREVISHEDERRNRDRGRDDYDRRERREDYDRRDDRGYQSRNSGYNDRREDNRYRERPPLPHQIRRDPSPEPLDSGSRSPPRKLKRPGARMSEAEREALKKQQEAREAERTKKAAEDAASRGVEEVVRAHYNNVPERGKTWRKTDSKISGLRSYNNWVKSTLIQKFATNEDRGSRLKVLDIGCGKGGDLLKWKSAPQQVELYVGVDSANVSIQQAKERYMKMRDGDMRRNRGRPADFHAEFFVLDAWTEQVDTNALVDEVVHRDGGFDVVSLMFCMHYAFESDAKIRGMLHNISSSLCRGGRFIGTIPSSDIIYSNIQTSETGFSFGNSLYRVSFPSPETDPTARTLPTDGAWRPPWGWKYSFFLEESVEDVPEYVVPWEAFRAIASEFGLQLEYKRHFEDIWNDEEKDEVLSDLSERMGVKERTRDRSGKRLVQGEEWEACKFYLGFAFRKA